MALFLVKWSVNGYSEVEATSEYEAGEIIKEHIDSGEFQLGDAISFKSKIEEAKETA